MAVQPSATMLYQRAHGVPAQPSECHHQRLPAARQRRRNSVARRASAYIGGASRSTSRLAS